MFCTVNHYQIIALGLYLVPGLQNAVQTAALDGAAGRQNHGSETCMDGSS